MFAAAGVLGIQVLGRQRRDAGTALSLVLLLGSGALLLSLTQHYGQAVYALLFGEVLGVSGQAVWPVAMLSAAAAALTLVLFRPLLLSSLVPELGEARGVASGRMELWSLAVVALATTVALPVVGALLVFSLTVGPASLARTLTDRPVRALALSSGLSVVTVWGAIALSFATDWPVGFFVGTLGLVAYLVGRSRALRWTRWGRHAGARLSA